MKPGPTVCSVFLNTGPISAKLFNAIRHVETGRQKNPKTVEGGREGDCFGPYQLKEQEAVEYDPSLVEGGQTWKKTVWGKAAGITLSK